MLSIVAEVRGNHLCSFEKALQRLAEEDFILTDEDEGPQYSAIIEHILMIEALNDDVSEEINSDGELVIKPSQIV